MIEVAKDQALEAFRFDEFVNRAIASFFYLDYVIGNCGRNT